MRKITLDPDDLRVTSFETRPAEPPRGTVRANVETEWATCQGRTCDGNQTCWDSCDGVCGSYFCATNGSCWNASCIQSCAQTCAPCYPTPGEIGTC